jgi:hypothetical protein
MVLWHEGGGRTLPIPSQRRDLPRCEWENRCSRLPFDATHAHASVMHGVCGGGEGALRGHGRMESHPVIITSITSHLSHADATDRNEKDHLN